jgi:hypothetical protein
MPAVSSRQNVYLNRIFTFELRCMATEIASLRVPRRLVAVYRLRLFLFFALQFEQQ